MAGGERLLGLEIDEPEVRVAEFLVDRREARFVAGEVLGGRHQGRGLASTLKEAARRIDPKGAAAHLILTDRRFIHLVAEAQETRPHLVQRAVEERVRDASSLPPETPLAMGTRILPGPGRRVFACALPLDVVESVLRAAREAGFDPASLTSFEEACSRLVGGWPFAEGECEGVLDLRASRARLVLVQDGIVAASRRLSMPLSSGLADSPDELTPPVLAAITTEVERTLAFFAKEGLKRPGNLLVTGDPEGMGRMAAEISAILGIPSSVPVSLAADPSVLPFAPARAVAAPCGRGEGLSLLEPPRKLLGKGAHGRRTEAASAGVLALALSGLLGLIPSRAETGTEGLEEILARKASLSMELDGGGAWLDPSQQALLAALAEARARRLPASFTLAGLAASLPEGVTLDRIHMGEGRTLLLEGRVQGATRSEAIRRFGQLAQALQGLPAAPDLDCDLGEQREEPDGTTICNFTAAGTLGARER